MLEFDTEKTSEKDTDQILQEMLSGNLNTPLRLGIVGGGPLCQEFIKFRNEHDLSGTGFDIVFVTDTIPSSPGMSLASKSGIETGDSYLDLIESPNVNAILDLSGKNEIQLKILQNKRSDCVYLENAGARLLISYLKNLASLKLLQNDRAGYIQKLRKHHTIIDSLPYRILVVNTDMTIDLVNETFLKDYGLKEEEVIGKKCYDIRYGFDKRCSFYGKECLMEETIDENNVVSKIVELVDGQGVKRYDVITVAPIAGENGEIVQHLEASRDVTERIQLEQAVQESHIFLHNVFQSAVDGIVVVDTKGKLILFNDGMETLTGYSAEEIMNHGHLSSFYDMDIARENMKKMRSDEFGPKDKLNPTSMNIRNKHGEQIPVTLSASIVKIDGQEVGSVGVFTDMREIEGMRRELDKAHLQLVQSEKVASVGRMAAGVAHEINNPLSIIMIYAELLEINYHEDMEALEDIREIITQTLRCKEIVSDLLEFSRKSIGAATQFDLVWFMNRCLNLLVKLASFHNIKVVKQFDTEMPQMTGDMGQLEQVFTNLFTNAADAMDGDGILSIAINYDKENDRFLINVADNGPGISQENLDKVFDIFFTTKPVGKGTGLGLSLSKNIIELHGGEIRIDCPPEGGTRFLIDLPREAMAPSEPDPVFVGIDEL